ncbi:MAG: Flp pilus assembly complex ATPase component TadA [Candidatus Hydrogenedentes bacterium]|nr:Flp pilus assembly complex ATPase component TadA [Candidatus Hydrogenedentota bacterium]
MSEERQAAKLGDELVKRDIITREELGEAQRRERASGIPWYRQFLQLKRVNFGVFEDILRYEFHSQSDRAEHQALGRKLVELKAITEEQLAEALEEQKRNGRLLGSILMDRGVVTGATIGQALSKQYGCEFAELAKTPSERRALDAVPESMAKKYQMIPVALEGDRLTVLITSPQAVGGLNHVAVMLGKRIHPILTGATDMRDEITRRYKALRSIASSRGGQQKAAAKAAPAAKPAPKAAASKKAAEESTKSSKASSKAKTQRGSTEVTTQEATEQNVDRKKDRHRFHDIAKEASGLPVIKLVSTIIEGAANSGATDIHLDPQDPEMRVRYRIDGILHDVMSIAPEIENAVVSRIKIMSDLDITETRHPQDGHISMEIGDTEFDIRVATMPTFLGERVVLRLLDQTSVLSGIKDLGLEKEDEDKLLRLVQQPYGMILVTGPTGSGKTTTLYASLNHKNVMTESIVTLEDPVEYQMSGINQVQIDTDIDLTFANTLRASLRQDIDVLLVGEIRDAETARIAIRASMTGHLVFSTLHTNDAPEAISTLRNMGIPSYLIASSLTTVLAQRLVRKICPDCKKGFTPTKALLKSLRLPESTKKLYRGAGCETCYHTGNKGRTGIFEVLEISPEIRRMIAADEPTDKIAKAAKLKTMADRCRDKVKAGIVAPEEFLRVIRT